MEKENDDCLAIAAEGGHLECLKWLFHALGCSNLEDEWWLYGFAADGGHLEICIWLLENGAPLYSEAFNSILQAGNLEVAQWGMQNGAVFDNETFLVATSSGRIELLEWLKLNNCHWGVLSQGARWRFTSSHVVNWLQENGFRP